jgi:hypothetical protein
LENKWNWLPNTRYPLYIDRRILRVPVARNNATGRLGAYDAFDDALYEVDEALLIRPPQEEAQ